MATIRRMIGEIEVHLARMRADSYWEHEERRSLAELLALLKEQLAGAMQ